MGADGPKPAGPEQTDAELANALEVESEDLELAARHLMEQEHYELAGHVELLAMDLPEAIRRLRATRPSSGDGEAGGFVGWVLEACYDGDWKPAGGPYSRSEADQEADRLLTEAGAEKVAFHECHTRSEPLYRAAPPEGEEVGDE